MSWETFSAADDYVCKRRAWGERMAKKRVMVVVDHGTGSKHAMVWALTHVANKGDVLTLLHVVRPLLGRHSGSDLGDEQVPSLATSLGSLCRAIRPEEKFKCHQVEVEALVIQGPKLATVLGQVKKLEVSVLVLSQSKPSLLGCLKQSSNEKFVEQCIDNSQCLTMAVRKRSSSVGGYMVSTRWQKNFWLLA